MLKAHRLPFGLQQEELLRVDMADDRQVVRRGPQVLADGDDIHTGLAQVTHHGAHFVERFA